MVVTGGTGRNFAAGMSGGIAYVLDEQGDFAIRCNKAMVKIEKIAEEPADREQMNTPEEKRGLPKNMLGHDALRLKTLIERHVRHTGSERAKMILDEWDTYLPRFVKVMPVEYRKVLENLAKR